MIRVGNLWEKFLSDENIMSAIRKAIKGKRDRPEIMEIVENRDVITEIKEMLTTGNLPKHRYRKVVIYEGKKRNIYVIDFYPWRIIHHMVINIIEPIFENTFIYHTYGCIRGKGQFNGSKQCWEMVKRYKYCLKCDIRKFYPNINQHILSNLVHRKIKDKKLLEVIDIIIFSHSKGCPIGNLPSQLFGNIYLSQLDHYIKHTIRFKQYIRYVDDFLFFSNNKEELNRLLQQFEPWLGNTLHLQLSKKNLFKTKQGVDFLGYRHFKNYKLLRKKTAYRFMRKVNHLYQKYDNNVLDLQQCMSVLSSIDGWIKNCNSYNLSKKLNTDRVRRDLTLKDFKQGNPFICGVKSKIQEQENVLVNAYSFDKDYMKIQYIDNNKVRYIRTKSKTLRNQFEQVDRTKVPFICDFKLKDRVLYAA